MIQLKPSAFRQCMLPLAVTGALTFGLAGCGGGSSSSRSPATDVGQFKDSNVEGLRYHSGNQSGLTNASGEFTHEVGRPVDFSIGGVPLGSIEQGKPLVTPLDLVEDGSSTNTTVLNIVRFLTLLDANGDPSDGITINNAVQTLADDWQPLDFASTHFDSHVTHIVEQLDETLPHTVTLPTAADAQAHLETTLRCAYSGAFRGNYRQHSNGNARGQFALLVSALNGTVTGWVWSAVNEQGEPDTIDVITLNGNQPLSYDQTMAFVSGFGSDSSNFQGNFTSPAALSGSYQFAYEVGANGGTFSGQRIAGASNAAWRFTGRYSGSTFGVMAFDISRNGQVVGQAYNVEDDQVTHLTGTLTGNTLIVNAAGQQIASGTLNQQTGSLIGTWDDGEDAGTFTGDGCRLN